MCSLNKNPKLSTVYGERNVQMTLVVKSPGETDLVVDAPFHWNVFLTSHSRLIAHDKPAPASLYSGNFTGGFRRRVDNHDDTWPPNFYVDG